MKTGLLMMQPELAISATFWLDTLTWIIGGILIAIVFAVPKLMKALHGNAASSQGNRDMAQKNPTRHSHRLGKLEHVTLPQDEQKLLNAIAQDGIELRFKLQSDLKFIGRPEGNEQAAVAVVLPMMASLISHIGKLPSHQTALIYPDKLVDYVVKQNHDQNTGWQLLNIQILDMTVGRNIGAILAKASAAGIDVSQNDLNLDDLADEFS